MPLSRRLKDSGGVLKQREGDPLVAGLDTAANRLHLVYSDGETHCSGPWKGVKWTDANARRQKLYEDAYYMFPLLPPGSHVFCEEPLALQNGKTTRMLGLAAGAIWAAHLEWDLWWHWVDVSSWKKRIVGNGNSKKEQIIEYVQKEHKLEYPEEDFYDAHCLMLYGQEWLTETIG